MFYMRNIVGPKVKKARRNLNPPLTQEGLATKLQLLGWNIQRTGVAKIEIGIRQITDIELVIMSKALGVTVQWLLED